MQKGESMIAYKVVEKGFALILSSPFVPATHKVCYEPGRMVKPKIGKLSVFKTLTNAKEFINPLMFGGYKGVIEIWRSEVKKSKRQYKVLLPTYIIDLYPDRVDLFWELEDVEMSVMFSDKQLIRVPEGTLFCDEVTILRCVKRYCND